MWQADGFKCLSPRRVISGELRSIVTWFMFLLMIAQASWDFLCTYIKYTEGFMQVAPGVIISKPFQYWAAKNKDPIEVMNYIQCVTFSLQVSILLLLQCFWNYLSNVVAKHSFMGSKEFVFYIVWTVGTIAMFPILQYFYKHTDLEEVVPQTAYACEILVVAVLGFRNHTRFNRLIKAATGTGKRSDVQVTDRLAYFRDMNLLLSMALLAFGGSMFILCIDGYTADKIINSNKFAADLLICNTNISSIFLWLIIIGIFHPARVSIDGLKKKGNQRTERFTATHDEQPKATQFAYAHDAKAYYMESSTKQLTSDSEFTASSSTAFQPPANVVSIDDPYAQEPISFSMMNSYGSSAAVDYYATHKLYRHPSSPLSPTHTFRSTAASPPPTHDLPPIPQQDTAWLEKTPSPRNM